MEQQSEQTHERATHKGARQKYGERQLTVRVTKQMDDALRDQARAEGIDIADVVRRALARGLTPT